MTEVNDLTRGLTSAVNSTPPSSKSPGKTAATDPNNLANKEVFLQLLIAQIKNQDPTKPADSIQYLTQLSQFTGVEQLVDIKATLKEISAALKTTNVGTAGTDPK